MKEFKLPPLPYGYDALEPWMSKQTLTLHHDKHHQAYVDKANAQLKAINEARGGGDIDMKAAMKNLSFNLGGHLMHAVFWRMLRPKQEDNKPVGKLAEAITEHFGSFEQLKKEFSAAAKSVEGSGWAALMACPCSGWLAVAQLEKHNQHHYPNFQTIINLDVWEHAFYLDYQNDKGAFVDGFWDYVNWEEADKKYSELVEKCAPKEKCPC